MDSHLNPPLDRHGGIRPDRPWTGNPTRRADARRGFSSSEAPLARRVSAALDFPSFASAPDPPQACGAGSWIRGRSSRTARMPRGGARFWALGPPCACSGGPSAREFPVRGLCVRARVGRDGDAGSTCGSRHGAPGRKVAFGSCPAWMRAPGSGRWVRRSLAKRRNSPQRFVSLDSCFVFAERRRLYISQTRFEP